MRKSMQKNSMVMNAVFNIIYRVLNVIFPLISTTYVAHILLPEGVGRVAFAQNIVSYFTMLASLGIPTYGMREIAKCRGDKKKTNRTFTELFIINAIATGICVGAYLVLIITQFNTDLGLYMVCGLLLFFNFINIDWFYQGEEEYVYVAIRSSIVKIAALAALFLFVKEQADYMNYAIINTLAAVGNHVFNMIHARKMVRINWKGICLRKHFKSVSNLTICVLAAELYCKIDITMLGKLCNKVVVGYYSNAQKLIAMVITLTTAISSIFLPRLSYYYNNNREKYNEYLSNGFEILLLLALPAYAGLIVVSRNLVYVLYGEAFLPAVPAMNILALLILIKSFGDLLCYQVVISSDNESKLFPSYLAAAVINVVMNYFLIPAFQQSGAAFASFISELVLNYFVYFFISRKVISLNIQKKTVASTLAGTGIMMGCVWLIGFFVENRFSALILQVITGIAGFILVNFWMKNEMLITLLKRIRMRI